MNKGYAFTCYPWINKVQYEITINFYSEPSSQDEADRYAEYLLNQMMKRNPTKTVEEVIKMLKE